MWKGKRVCGGIIQSLEGEGVVVMIGMCSWDFI
jgi:hypothetical protein